MNSTGLSSGVMGKTIRFAWTDGPTKGKTHEHVFHDDGTVEWHAAGEQGGAGAERAKFVDEAVAGGIRMVSYLSKSGFTLTVVLNDETASIVGVASNEKTWMPVHGTFEVVS